MLPKHRVHADEMHHHTLWWKPLSRKTPRLVREFFAVEVTSVVGAPAAFAVDVRCVVGSWHAVACRNYKAPPAPSGVAAFMSAHSNTQYITPSMDFPFGKGVVWGCRGQQLEFTLVDVRRVPLLSSCCPLHPHTTLVDVRRVQRCFRTQHVVPVTHRRTWVSTAHSTSCLHPIIQL